MNTYNEQDFWDLLTAKVLSGLDITDGEISLAISYITDEMADKQGYAQAASIINDIKKL